MSRSCLCLCGELSGHLCCKARFYVGAATAACAQDSHGGASMSIGGGEQYCGIDVWHSTHAKKLRKKIKPSVC